jgi:hypothetical protein
VNELRRLANLVRRGIPGRDAFNATAETLYDLLDSSGVFDHSSDPGLLDSLLHQIDELRNTLD